MGGLFMSTRPGDQVLVIPNWAARILTKKGQIADVVNFAKMRQWFTQEQLVAIDVFSTYGLDVLYRPNIGATDPYTNEVSYSNSASWHWFFPESSGVSQNGSDADKYAQDQLSSLRDNKVYAKKMLDQYVLGYFAQDPEDKIDLHQSYSVYSASDKLIVLALGQGILSPAILTRKEELRLLILRSIVEKLEMYYESQIVHGTSWFELYLKELDLLK